MAREKIVTNSGSTKIGSPSPFFSIIENGKKYVITILGGFIISTTQGLADSCNKIGVKAFNESYKKIEKTFHILEKCNSCNIKYLKTCENGIYIRGKDLDDLSKHGPVLGEIYNLLDEYTKENCLSGMEPGDKVSHKVKEILAGKNPYIKPGEKIPLKEVIDNLKKYLVRDAKGLKNDLNDELKKIENAKKRVVKSVKNQVDKVNNTVKEINNKIQKIKNLLLKINKISKKIGGLQINK